MHSADVSACRAPLAFSDLPCTAWTARPNTDRLPKSDFQPKKKLILNDCSYLNCCK